MTAEEKIRKKQLLVRKIRILEKIHFYAGNDPGLNEHQKHFRLCKCLSSPQNYLKVCWFHRFFRYEFSEKRCVVC